MRRMFTRTTALTWRQRSAAAQTHAHALIGAGVYASHGYERSHVDGVKNTLELLAAYLDK